MIFKWLFDRIVAFIGLAVLWPVLVVVAILVKVKMPGGPAFFVQKRVGKDGKLFDCHKFRTMTVKHNGSTVSVAGDSRITPLGAKLRHYKLDELPGLWDVLIGNMSFVGPRPEAVKYVEKYEPEYYATLLMPAGITSEASIRYKDEDKLLDAADDVDRVYLEKVLPDKMKWNLKSISGFSFGGDIMTMFRTVAAVAGKDYQ